MSRKIKTDAEILNGLMQELDLSGLAFSLKLGYKSPQSIYAVVRDGGTISVGMRNKIMLAYPKINELYLSYGELPILLNEEEQIGQTNLMNRKPTTIDIWALMLDMNETMTAMKEQLDILTNKKNSETD